MSNGYNYCEGQSKYYPNCGECSFRPVACGGCYEYLERRIAELEAELAEAQSLHCETINQRTALINENQRLKEALPRMCADPDCPIECGCHDICTGYTPTEKEDNVK